MVAFAFYHLTRSMASEALPALLKKTLESEKRALVCCDKERFNQFSTAIWSTIPDSWLPHGIKGKDDDSADLCPIWITDDAANNVNEAGFFFFLDGHDPALVEKVERGFILFEGGDEARKAEARSQWKALSAGGHELSYWQQSDSGKWTKAK